MIEINKTKLNRMIITILCGHIPYELKIIGEKIFNEKSNYDFHINKVNDLLKLVVCSNTPTIFKELSRLNITKEPIIKIYLIIKKKDGKIDFYFCGNDLKDFHMHLPKFTDNKAKKIIKPTTGTNNSKWYSYDSAFNKYIRNVSLNLRLLDIYLKNVNIIDIYDEKIYGILGLEVKFEIPESLKDNSFVNDINELNSTLNPTKIDNGMFIFGKNGITDSSIKNMFLIIEKELPSIYAKIYPHLIIDCDLNDFMNSSNDFALSCWNKHCRILIKQKNNKCIDKCIDKCNEEMIDPELDIMNSYHNNDIIQILDPWMNFLPICINNELKKNNRDILFQFVQRNTKDQIKGEGSCVLSGFARLLFLINEDDIYFNKFNLKIPDFYAYLAKLIYRKSICK